MQAASNQERHVHDGPEVSQRVGQDAERLQGLKNVFRNGKILIGKVSNVLKRKIYSQVDHARSSM